MSSNYLKKRQTLLFCLVLECVTLCVGMELFNPFPFKDLGNDHSTVFVTLVFLGLSCVYGAVVTEISGILGEKKPLGYFTLACLFLAFVSPIWPILLGIVIIFTIILLLTQKRRSSNYWGFFYTKKSVFLLCWHVLK